jgi:glycosyltransferase involved in cell wall biosynthesis
MGLIRNRLAIRLLTALERAIYRWAEVVVASSPGMEAAVRQAAPPGKRVVTVPNSCDTDRFHPDVDGSAVRHQRRWANRFVCAYLGAMGPANGLDAIVEAADRFRDDPDWLFVLVGEGTEKERMQARCDRLELKNVQFLDGIPKCDLPALLAAADLALVTFAPVPILEHNSANKFFDALSAGKPVVLNYGGWQREVIEAAGAGLGCRMGDNEEFFEALGALKSAPARRAAMGRQARKLATERFSRDMLAARTLAVLVEAAGPDRVS